MWDAEHGTIDVVESDKDCVAHTTNGSNGDDGESAIQAGAEGGGVRHGRHAYGAVHRLPAHVPARAGRRPSGRRQQLPD